MSIFHYTDKESLLSIIKNNELWATCSDFLIDADELNHFKELFISINEKTNIPAWRIIKKIFIKRFEKASQNVFIISFSTEKDAFNLWSYFSNNNGYNIEFSETELYRYLNLIFKYNEHTPSHMTNNYINNSQDIIVPNYEIIQKNTMCCKVKMGSVIYEDNMKAKIISELSFGKRIEGL